MHPSPASLPSEKMSGLLMDRDPGKSTEGARRLDSVRGKKILPSIFGYMGLRVPLILLATLALYLFLSAENLRIHRLITQTNRFSDSLSSLENVTNLFLLNTLSDKNVFPFPSSAYREGLLIQGQAVLSTMLDNASFLPPEDRRLLSDTSRLFGRFRSRSRDESTIEHFSRLDRKLVLLFARLSDRTSESRILLFRRLLLVNLARGGLLLTILTGGGFFFFQKMSTSQKTSRQNHFYQALSRIDRVILTLPEVETLLTETCRIVVEEGGVSLARFICRDTGTPKGHVLAQFGHASRDFEHFEVSSNPSIPEGRGLWGETVRTGRPVIWNNIEKHLTDVQIRELYLRSGIMSGAGFPVSRGGNPFGVLLVHASEPDFFDSPLVDLINILVENLSFAIDNRDREEERLRREAEYTHLSLFDSLTDLPNRRLFQDRTAQAIERYRRKREPFVLGILDLDGFKFVNDRLGHPAGDRLLILVAERLKAILRSTDTLARLGGDEFGLLLAGVEGSGGSDLFDRIIHSLSIPFSHEKESISISGSIGFTVVPPDDADAETLFKHADIALYQVKEHGKNGWQAFSIFMAESLNKQHSMQLELVSSIRENRFVFHYQPQAELRSGKVVGVEALLRWNHPAKGLLEAGSFIRTLEDCDAILETEQWGLEEILRQSDLWRRQGLNLPVRMNISCRSLLSGRFPSDLKNAFGRYPRLSPSLLELDISDTKLFRDIRKVKGVVDECRITGVSFSIGNLGNEQGALSYLQTLGIDRVTIPRNFVKNLEKSPNDMAIVASLITSARLLLVDAVGEGIETEQEGLHLLQWGCQIGQGNAISPPIPPDKIPEWIRSYRNFSSWENWTSPPWGLTDYSLLMAKGAARVFYANFLTGIGIPGETRPEWTDSHRCMQGRWIDGDGQSTYGGIPEFEEYRKIHEHLHTLIQEALHARDNHEMERLSSLKEEIRQTNQSLLEHLENLQGLRVLNTGNTSRPHSPRGLSRPV
ncbi:diguanylate cyclase (GGDEF domain) [Leptospirillum ferriphilum]|uniref:Diguanylate cyclase (GGDEF domain) n=2 Tax=Leptospirillum TaxID=179 RepID=A0A094YIZ0_9BACT|nr:MAG: Diguanylate cyclase/phosphodiesterase with GAF sensor [Leptospirillum rubarum]EDZ38759.1 MAG: Diguanylate cyclase/phosphodiesterase with GAF sensor [Leptospirillum sp. Group II '5-way CG']EIJ77370.1 MAG: Diguanylate cyclase/phosphodiesterase with GAF sensor [Leptospirillum sp. Group II 'C75']KGA93161.1 diguanylate cyclase (GGDEF domain) [Leptospirillum ferriphilum]